MQNAIIKGGESLSSAISLWNTRHFALDIPEDFTGTSITFQGGGADFVTRNIYDSAGAELTATVAPGTMCSLSGVAAALAPYRSLRIRSGTAASPTVQLGAGASSAVVDFGDDKTLTITSGVKGTRGDSLSVVFEMNSEDTLSVTNPDGGEILVKLASTTASKNTAALIEDGIQTLADVGGVDVSGLTVVGSEEYTAAPPVGVQSKAVVDFGDDKTLTFTYELGGLQGNGLLIRVVNNDTDALSVSNPESSDQVLIKLATTTASKNAASAIQTALQDVASTENYTIANMTVAGSEEYNAAPPAGDKAVVNVIYISGGESVGRLDLTAGCAGPQGRNVMMNLIYQAMEANSTDDLSVAWFDYEGNQIPLPDYPMLHVKLANQTPSKNTAAAIQAAIEALMLTSPLTSENVYGGIYADLQPYITGMTVEGDDVWDAAPPVASPGSTSRDLDTFVNGTLPILNLIDELTEGGADAPGASGALSGGEDVSIRVLLKE
jgi:hypothetical protein